MHIKNGHHICAAAKVFTAMAVIMALSAGTAGRSLADVTESAVGSSNIIWDPSVSVKSLAENGPAGSSDSGGDYSGTLNDSESTFPADPAAASLENPGTVIETSDPSIVYINGRSIDLSLPVAAFTYDDGPRTDVGNRIMDVMAQYGQKCTFFVLGVRIASRADEIQRMVQEGHEIGNHTYSHEYLTKVTAEELVNQVEACTGLIESYAGVTPSLMRLPGGLYNESVLGNINMPIILWNIDTRDWETKSAAKTVSSVLENLKSGDIVLMHETYECTAEATEILVPELTAQGYQLVTVSELAALNGVELLPGTIYRHM